MRFLFYARPVFRVWEVCCNHLARWLTDKRALHDVRYQRQLAQLNLRRMEIQRGLGQISRSHAHVCAQCGYCCKGTHLRDAFLDRVLQNPQTEHLGARRRTGEMVGFQLAREQKRVLHLGAERPPGCCNELTCHGCRLPNELRPMQCLAYFCGAAVRALSQEECEQGIRLIRQLLRLHWDAVKLALHSRWKQAG
ncbi:MAG: hypothetical protein NZL85_09915, partial [Fimbriimonadales bacterium]|nr:hypothetical protein [Fimbriimonadales bacterium]